MKPRTAIRGPVISAFGRKPVAEVMEELGANYLRARIGVPVPVDPSAAERPLWRRALRTSTR